MLKLLSKLVDTLHAADDRDRWKELHDAEHKRRRQLEAALNELLQTKEVLEETINSLEEENMSYRFVNGATTTPRWGDN